MPGDPVSTLNDVELDALWTVYEGHSLVIERPVGDDIDDYAHAVMSVAYDEEDEALAEVAELPLDTVESLIERGFFERSMDGPILDASSWFDEELERQVEAEEYVLSELGQRAVESTADYQAASGPAASNGYDEYDDDDDDGDDDDFDDDFDDEFDGEWDDDFDDDTAADDDVGLDSDVDEDDDLGDDPWDNE